MARLYVYADESGNFDFSRGRGATRYFIVTTVVLPDHSLGDELLALRRQLGWEGVSLQGEFHATEDRQHVRDRVFSIIQSREFRIDTTILDKPKTHPHMHSSETRFYQTAFFYHMRYVIPRILGAKDELMVTAASVGTKAKRAAFYEALNDVIEQVAPKNRFSTAFWPACVEPCLQVADYCSWAIQRKWEAADLRSYRLISGNIQSEFDTFRWGTTLYY